MSSSNKDLRLHVALYPWLAMGHITSFLRLGNKLAEQGHKVTLFVPSNTLLRFASQNHHPHFITFVSITLPPMEGLPSGAETTNDVPASARPLLMTAMDMTKDIIEAHLVQIKPDIIFFDFAHWIPELAKKHGIKSIYYFSGLIVRFAYMIGRDHKSSLNISPTETDIMRPPPSFPSGFTGLQVHEARALVNAMKIEFGGGMTLGERLGISFRECDAIGVKTCKEMEGEYCEYVSNNIGKPVLAAGPVVPDPQTSKLDAHFDSWLNEFGASTVIYCAFGSECTLKKDQFQQLVLGLELTGRPFLAALKPPTGSETIEAALPEGFEERTKGKGIVYGGWVQQQLILQHPSVGCFVTHCGAGSLSEVMVSKCQLVMIPQAVDQFINARFMSSQLKVGVEVEKGEEDGFFTKEAVLKAVSIVMEETSEVGKEVKVNHAKWRDFILREGVEESYISDFIQHLVQLIK